MYSVLRTLFGRAHHHWHARRAQLFIELMRPQDAGSILDLGGADGSFMARIRNQTAAAITVADLGDLPLPAQRRYGFRPVCLREGEPLPFSDGEFDIVFCNSVIEHVTLPKAACLEQALPERKWRSASLARQNAFAREIRRVGSQYFVQTPHRHFPIESHTWLPFVNWLPHDATRAVVRVTDRWWVKRCGYVDWNLLTPGDVAALFPDANIHVERALGIPKSIIAYSPRPNRTVPKVQLETRLRSGRAVPDSSRAG